MAAEIESLRNYKLEDLEEILERMSKDEPLFSYTTVKIEVDGEIFEIPEAVNNLLNSLYQMYQKESDKNKHLK